MSGPSGTPGERKTESLKDNLLDGPESHSTRMMQSMDDDTDRRTACVSGRLVSIAVIVGITLFIAGFVLTVTSLSGNSSANGDGTGLPFLAEDAHATSDSANLVLFLGLVLGLSGLVLATTVPAAWFIRNSRHKA